MIFGSLIDVDKCCPTVAVVSFARRRWNRPEVQKITRSFACATRCIFFSFAKKGWRFGQDFGDFCFFRCCCCCCCSSPPKRHPRGEKKWQGENPIGFFRPRGFGFPIWVFPKIGGKPPKMDGENNGKPYLNGWFGVKTPIFRNINLFLGIIWMASILFFAILSQVVLVEKSFDPLEGFVLPSLKNMLCLKDEIIPFFHLYGIVCNSQWFTWRVFLSKRNKRGPFIKARSSNASTRRRSSCSQFLGRKQINLANGINRNYQVLVIFFSNGIFEWDFRYFLNLSAKLTCQITFWCGCKWFANCLITFFDVVKMWNFSPCILFLR